MDKKLVIAIIVSFGLYFLPFPLVHTTQTWWQAILSLKDPPSTPYFVFITMIIFAILYQIFTIFVIYKILNFPTAKKYFVLMIVSILLYVGLITTAYALLMILVKLTS